MCGICQAPESANKDKLAELLYEMDEPLFTYYTVWCRTFEGDERWHTGKFPEGTNEYHAQVMVESTLVGGVGGDPAEFIRLEGGYTNTDEDEWNITDYTYLDE